MDVVNSMIYGFSVALQPDNLFFVFLGTLLGTLVGVLPGLGPVAAISILLPVTFKLSAASAIIMLAGLYYGVQYGGSTTSILINVPGETSSIVTCLDGHQMALKGRAGPALGMAAFGSFIAGTLGVVGLMIFAVPLSRFALRFGPPEYFAVILLGLTFVTYFSRGSMIKALMMASFGIILSSIGLDTITSTPRMTFDLIQLYDGLSIAPVGMGLFGIGEVLFNFEESGSAEVVQEKIKGYFPTKLDWIKSKGAILRGTILGFFLGVLPGGGPVLSTFMSYGIEKKLSKEPETFGQGAIQGVAGPESANNSAASAAFIPLLTLGLPPNVVLSLMFGALLIHGVTPGPFLIQKNPDIFWGVISSMYIGNVMLLILNLPLIPLWVQVLRVPSRVLYPLVLLFCLIGGYSLNNNILDVIIMIIFGVLGYLFRKFHYEGAPLILAFVLGPIIENNLRQSLILSRGSFTIFFARPISAITLTMTILLIVSSIFPSFRQAKKKYEVTS